MYLDLMKMNIGLDGFVVEVQACPLQVVCWETKKAVVYLSSRVWVQAA